MAHAAMARFTQGNPTSGRLGEVNSFSKFAQTLNRVATFCTPQSGQPVFDGAHHSERNIVVRKPFKVLQLNEKQLRSILNDL
jgi:hypothetical protein